MSLSETAKKRQALVTERRQCQGALRKLIEAEDYLGRLAKTSDRVFDTEGAAFYRDLAQKINLHRAQGTIRLVDLIDRRIP